MNSESHVIGRQVLHLIIEDDNEAFKVQEAVCETFRTHVVPAMAELLDRYDVRGAVIRLDQLDVDVGFLDMAQLDASFPTQVRNALESKLNLSLGSASGAASPSERVSREEHVLALWHYVMLRGHLPWWAPPAAAAELDDRAQQVLEEQGKLPHETRKMFRLNPVGVRRLALQGSEPLVKRVLRLVDGTLADACLPVFDAIGNLLDNHPITAVKSDVFQLNFRMAALSESFHPTARATDARLLRVLREAFQESVIQASITYEDVLLHIRSLFEPSIVTEIQNVPADARQALVNMLRRLSNSNGLSQPTHAIDSNGAVGGEERMRTHDPQDEQDRRASKNQITGRDTSTTTRKEGTARSQQKARACETSRDRSDYASTQNQGTKRDREIGRDSGTTPIHGTEHSQQAAADPEITPDPGMLSAGGSMEDTPPVASRPEDAVRQNQVDFAQISSPESSPAMHGESSETASTRRPRIENEERRDSDDREGGTIYVDDAGIVLLHPFLRMHFDKLELSRERAFVSKSCQERAVHQLRFLATGEQEMPEHALVLPKLLCGLTPDDPIPRAIPIDDRARSEADVLLKAVIRHWGALKNSSPDGLRETFLRREGRLTRRSDEWHLRVESRSYDLLLDRLPWLLSIISLPWMPELLRVEWT